MTFSHCFFNSFLCVSDGDGDGKRGASARYPNCSAGGWVDADVTANTEPNAIILNLIGNMVFVTTI